MWTELATSRDCRRQKISKLNTFSFFAVLSCLDPVSSLQLWFGAGNGLRITTDKAHIATWCENCIATASDSATTSECGRYCSTTFWARSGHRSSDATPTFVCPSLLDGELWRHIWKLGQDLFTNVFTPQTGLDKAVQSQILRTTENCGRLSPTQFTPPTPTRQDSFVSGVN